MRKTCPDCGRPIGDSSKHKGGMSPKTCLTGKCGGIRNAPPPPPSTKSNNLRRIEAYKKICELAGVPQLLIDYPELIFSNTLTADDISWAKGIIKIHQEPEDFIDPSIH